LFTPGPWVAFKPIGSNGWIKVDGPEEMEVCVCYSPHEHDPQANAHLIAAAPDMYEALKDLIVTASKLWDEPIKDSDYLHVSHPIIEMAKMAIAKAEGGQAIERD